MSVVASFFVRIAFAIALVCAVPLQAQEAGNTVPVSDSPSAVQTSSGEAGGTGESATAQDPGSQNDSEQPNMAAEPNTQGASTQNDATYYSKDANICLNKDAKKCEMAPQGDCNTRISTPGFSIDWRISTASCPGTTPSNRMLRATFGDGSSICVFIDNYSNLTKAEEFFVPVRTRTEWDKFAQSTKVRANRDPLDNTKPMVLVYGCPQGEGEITCEDGRKVTIPITENGRDQARATFTRDIDGVKYSGQFQCSSSFSCADWTLVPGTAKCGADTSSVSIGSTSCPAVNGDVHADVAMLFDASQSMDEEILQARDDTKRLIATIGSPQQDLNLSLTRFGGRKAGDNANYTVDQYCRNVEQLAGPGRISADQAYVSLNNFSAEGLTPMALAMQQAADKNLTNTGRQRYLILLSDGEETCMDDATPTINALKAKGIKLLGIRYKTAQAEDPGSLYGKSNFDKFDFYRDVVIADGNTSQNDDLYNALVETFGIITKPACELKASVYKQGDRTTPVATITGAQSVSLPNGTYDVVFTLCSGQTETRTVTLKGTDQKLDSSLTCPANR